MSRNSFQAAIDKATAAQQPRNVAARATVKFLDPPPSVNTLYVEFRTWNPHARQYSVRRSMTKDYRIWKDQAVRHIKQVQRCPMVEGDVTLDWVFATNRRRDLDGYLKAAIDALVAARVIEDDRRVTRIMAAFEMIPDGVGAVCDVRRVYYQGTEKAS